MRPCREALGQDRFRGLVDVLIESIDDWATGLELAKRAYLSRVGREFVELVGDIECRDACDTAFVDATCDPPESFTFGGAVSHVISWDAHRRQIVVGASGPAESRPSLWTRSAGSARPAK
jgi:hypothetical protein